MPYLSTGLRNKMLGDTTNMLTNGAFTSDATSWTAVNGAVLASVAGGQAGNNLRITNAGASAGGAYQDITVIPGQSYQLAGYFKKGTATSGTVSLGVSGNPTKFGTTSAMTFADWNVFSLTALMGTAETTLRISLDNLATDTLTGFFDTLTLVRKASGLGDVMKSASINIYTGTRPATADAAATGTLLATFTGVTFANASAGAVALAGALSVAAAATGTAGYGIIYESGDVPGNSTSTASRICFTVGTSGSELILNTTSLTIGGTSTISSGTITFPFGA